MDSEQTIGSAINPSARSGAGFVELVEVAGRTVVTRCRANSPLRILTPRDDHPAARVVAGSYGGGLVGGDMIELTVDAGLGTRCLLSTQASTKIYRSTHAECSQRLNVAAAERAIVISLPDPVVCFAESRFSQRQQFNLAATASLLMLDWFTSGRVARGERWAMGRYGSQTEIKVDGNCVFRDCIELDQSDGEIGAAMRMGAVDCFATVVLVGPTIADYAKAVVDGVQRQSIAAGESLLFGASQLPGAAVLRVAGKSSEAVTLWLREKLAFVSQPLDMDPWQRKW